MIQFWDDLKEGDKIYYLILDGENLRELFENRLKVQDTIIEDIINTGSYMSIHTDFFGELILDYKDFFVEGHSQTEYDDNILLLAVNYEGIKEELKFFINRLNNDIDLY